MSFSKLFVRGSVFLFIIMGIMAWLKKGKNTNHVIPKKVESVLEAPKKVLNEKKKLLKACEPNSVEPQKAPIVKTLAQKPKIERKDFIYRFFSKGSDKFDFIQTIKYTSRVSWLKGRPAWIADYAAHFNTSRHFIARGLNKKEDYDSQNVTSGDHFNVFKEGYPVEFQLVANLATCSMNFYCIHGTEGKKEFVKSYKISVGRKDADSSSGYLTPLGKFSLGENIAVYRPGVFNFFQNQKIEMMQVFGTRWLPFDKELGECTDGAKGYGLHGLPCKLSANSELVEDTSLDGTYSSDGCIRLKKRDIEELFSIIITKPTTIEIVNIIQNMDEIDVQENMIVKNSEKLS